MDESNVFVTMLLFAGLFLSWSKAVISAAIAIIIRNRALSLVVVLIVGAFEGLFGSRLELLDLYLSRTGWQAIDALTVITVVLSALGSLLWWVVARALYALVRRVIRGTAAASAASQMKTAAAVLRRLNFTDRAQRAAALAPPLVSCIVTEEIWLPGEFSEIAWRVAGRPQRQMRGEIGAGGPGADHAALHGAGDFARGAVRRFAPCAGDVAIDGVHAALSGRTCSCRWRSGSGDRRSCRRC